MEEGARASKRPKLKQHVEFYFASDASAMVEHTKRVLHLEDDDVAHLHDGLRVRLASRERAFVALLSDFIEGANELLSTKYSDVLSTNL